MNLSPLLHRQWKNFHHPIELLPYAKEVLAKFSIRKILYTKGILSEQMLKLNRSGLSFEFFKTHVASKKSAEELDAFLKTNNLCAAECLYIGNSVKHDIAPALEVGCSAIWLDHKNNEFGRNAALPQYAYIAQSWMHVERILLNEVGLVISCGRRC
jgi:putative hydrolase of the HAD superfamily